MAIKDIRTLLVGRGKGMPHSGNVRICFRKRKKEVDRQIAGLQTYRDCIEFKCSYYRTALEAGTEKIHWSKDNQAPDMALSKIANIERRRNHHEDCCDWWERSYWNLSCS
ncbi:hypothetical protein [Paenibacillus lautus]|uniref:hypothetical protein n=1 Tax=Paenibacillus lautus TaxID=1401 RepID=UPI003D2CD786